MKRRLPATVTHGARALRGLWPDRNPLRRGVDRLEAVIAGALAVAFLVITPLSAMTAARMAHGADTATARAQQAAWHPVPAVLLKAAPVSHYTTDRPRVLARWTAPDGGTHTGIVLAPQGTPAGSTVRIWVDASGQVTGAPLQPMEVRNQTLLAAVLASLAVTFVLLGAGLLAHCVLERRRAAAWDTDWGSTEPQWTRRH
jgi:hypothetical protein